MGAGGSIWGRAGTDTPAQVSGFLLSAALDLGDRGASAGGPTASLMLGHSVGVWLGGSGQMRERPPAHATPPDHLDPVTVSFFHTLSPVRMNLLKSCFPKPPQVAPKGTSASSSALTRRHLHCGHPFCPSITGLSRRGMCLFTASGAAGLYGEGPRASGPGRTED